MRETTCSVMVSSVKIGIGGRSLSPGVAQCTCRWSGLVGIGAVLEHDLVGVDALDVAEPHDVLDPPELLELAGAERGALHHRRLRPTGRRGT